MERDEEDSIVNPCLDDSNNNNGNSHGSSSGGGKKTNIGSGNGDATNDSAGVVQQLSALLSNPGITDLLKVLSQASGSTAMNNNNHDNNVDAGCSNDADEQYDEELLDEDEEDDQICDPVQDSVKKLVEKRSTEICEDLYKAKLKKARRPSNVELHCPRVNPEIWSSLPMNAKQRDKG